jgi:hemerythrin superfamily protein
MAKKTKNAQKKSITKSTAKTKRTKSKPKKSTKAAKQATSQEDIVQLILRDHRPLKALIKVMKDKDSGYAQKKAAFEQFGPLLVAHAKPEEQTWYVHMKKEDDMRMEALEGDTEHGLADQMCEEAKRTTDKDLFMAKVKVLAELVEHHIEEEEEDLLPEFKKVSPLEDRILLGQQYIQFRAEFEAAGGDDAPHEGSKKAEILEESTRSNLYHP